MFSIILFGKTQEIKYAETAAITQLVCIICFGESWGDSGDRP